MSEPESIVFVVDDDPSCGQQSGNQAPYRMLLRMKATPACVASFLWGVSSAGRD